MARSSREVTKIFKSYRTPSIPGSFSSVQKFRHALRDRLGIDIQLGELKDILEKDFSNNKKVVRGHTLTRCPLHEPEGDARQPKPAFPDR